MREKIVNCLLVTAGGVLLVAGHEFVKVGTDIHQTAVAIQQLTAEANLTVRAARVQGIKLAGQASETITESKKTLHAYRGLADNVRQASLDERDAIQQFNDEGVKTVHSLDKAITEAADSFQTISTQSQQTLASTSKAMDAAAGLISDPRIPKILENVQIVTNNAAKVSADVQFEVNKFTHPAPQPWWMRAYNFGKAGGQITYSILTLK